MWYTKNNLRLAQLTQIAVPDDDPNNGDKIKRYNHYVDAINNNSTNKDKLKYLYKHIKYDEEPSRFDTTYNKEKLLDEISRLFRLIHKADKDEVALTATSNTFTPELIKRKIIDAIRDIRSINYVGSYFNYDVEITFDQNNYYASVITNYKDKTFPYLFNFKNEDELDSRLPNLIKYLNELGTKTSQGQNSTGAGTTNNNSQNGESNNDSNNSSDLAKQIKDNQDNAPQNQPNQELVLLSPVSNGIANIRLPSELLNQYNEARNSGSMIKFEVTKSQNGTNQIAVKEASQYYTQHPELLEKIRLFLEENGKFQFATNDAAEVIPAEYILFQTYGIEPINYAPAKLNIFVPGAAEKAPIDLFLDGQKIATVMNNTDFTFDNKKYPLLVGKHVLEARAEKTPSLTPIQDNYLKVLSKNRSYYFNVEEGKIPNLTIPINDLSTYKAADAESYGSGLAVKLRENPYRSPERDLIKNKVSNLHPAFKRYYIVKTRISDNDPDTRANIINRAVDLQNAIAQSKSLISGDEYEDYVTAVLNLEGAGGYASDEQLNAIINKIQVERPNPPEAPAE